jgi:hypothetical protein
MKRSLVAVVFVITLFAAQNANGQISNHDVAVQTPSSYQLVAEYLIPLEMNSEDNNAPATCYSYWVSENVGWYTAKFTNNCDVALTFHYQYTDTDGNWVEATPMRVSAKWSGVPGYSRRGIFEINVYKIEEDD